MEENKKKEEQHPYEVVRQHIAEKAPEEVWFYSHTKGETYGALSNFAPSPFVLGGKEWPTVEHYFQAQKFAGTEKEEQIRLLKKPMDAAREGRKRNQENAALRADWQEIKDGVMERALYAKFTQNEPLKQLLLSTGDKRLVEDTFTTDDRYWGIGTEGNGKNMLGVLLMKVRDRIREEEGETQTK
ncbi:Swarming motility protein ybiA [Balamuthia mandrillaris]